MCTFHTAVCMCAVCRVCVRVLCECVCVCVCVCVHVCCVCACVLCGYMWVHARSEQCSPGRHHARTPLSK